MCYFIVIGIPRDSKVDLSEYLTDGLSIDPIENALLSNAMRTAIDLHLLTSSECLWGNTGHCSCGLFVGEDAPDETEAIINKKREKYTKLGWSAAKMERAIRDRGFEQADDSIGMREDAREFLARVAETARIIGVVAFYHGGEVATWRDTGHDREYRTASKVRDSKTAISEDVLTWIRPNWRFRTGLWVIHGARSTARAVCPHTNGHTEPAARIQI